MVKKIAVVLGLGLAGCFLIGAGVAFCAEAVFLLRMGEPASFFIAYVGAPIVCGIAAVLCGRRIADPRRRLLFRAALLAAAFAPGYMVLDGSAEPEFAPAWFMLFVGLINPSFFHTTENPNGLASAALRWNYLRDGSASLAIMWLAVAGIAWALGKRRASPGML